MIISLNSYKILHMVCLNIYSIMYYHVNWQVISEN